MRSGWYAIGPDGTELERPDMGVRYTPDMDRGELLAWWNEANDACVWWAPWSRVLDGLTAEQAAWKPAAGRHSIWDLVNHLTFWREYFVHRNEGGEPMAEDELDGRNWTPPEEVTEAAWQAAQRRFAESHAKVRAALEAPSPPVPPKPQLDLRYLLFHDTYHVGQVMYLRALLGMAPLET